MSDYLNTLLARTRHLSPVVQPRLASLFEPAAITNVDFSRPAFAEAAAAGRETHAESESATQSSPLAASQTIQPARRHLPSANALPAASFEREKQDEIDGRRASREDLPGHFERPLSIVIPASPSSSPSPFARPSAGGVQSEAVETLRPLRPSPRLPAPRASEEKAGMPSTVETVERENRAGLEPEIRRIVREQLAPLQLSHTRASGERETVSPRQTPPAVSPVAAHTQAYRTHAPAQTLPSELAAPSPPTINVTIGRVEVRAVVSPPPAAPVSRRTAQPAGAPSLGEYLKQRSGERR